VKPFLKSIGFREENIIFVPIPLADEIAAWILSLLNNSRLITTSKLRREAHALS